MFSGSLVAIVTPMRPDGRVDFEAWARLVDFHLQNGTTGIVVDNVATGVGNAQANSIYFGALGANTAVKLTQGGLQ